MIRPARLTLACVLGLALAPVLAKAQMRQIAADLSDHQIEITTGFDGAELLLFGHDSGEAEVMVIVRGPDAPVAVRRKERVAGIWVNGQEVVFPSAPSFFFVGVTDGLRDEDGLDKILEQTGLGVRYLSPPTADRDLSLAVAEEYRDALVTLRARSSLYSTTAGAIAKRDDGLFRIRIPFPAATPTGEYAVTVYHIVDGWPVSGDTTPLQVKKVGFGAFIYDIAHREPLLYGLIAILAALGAGWAGGSAFRRG